MDEQPEIKYTKFGMSVRCKAIPQPPGTKARGRMSRGLENELPSSRWRLVTVAVVAALVVGVVVGRWLLP